MSKPLPRADGTCLITGCSSGIGVEIARDLAGRGYNVTLVARREDRLVELAAELEREYNITATVAACDITDTEAVDELLDQVEKDGMQIDVLANNAGVGTGGYFADQTLDSQLQQVDLNIRALVYLTGKILPQMLERGSGAILNTASTAAYQPMTRQAIYAASKAFVLHFGEALSVELKGTGVTCTSLCPGPVKTEFFADFEMSSSADSAPDFVWLTAEETAKAGVEAMFRGQRVSIPKTLNKIGAVASKLSPRGAVLYTVDKFWPVGR